MVRTWPVVLLCLVACSSPPPQHEGATREMASACAAQDGFIDQRGMLGREVCVHRYPDGGQICRSKSDCTGKCIIKSRPGGFPRDGEEATGTCQDDDTLFGCFAEVDGGVIVLAMCVD